MHKRLFSPWPAFLHSVCPASPPTNPRGLASAHRIRPTCKNLWMAGAPEPPQHGPVLRQG